MSAELRKMKLGKMVSSASVPEAFDVDFGGATVIGLYGPNGSGKSTILEAASIAVNHTFFHDRRQTHTAANSRNQMLIAEAFCYYGNDAEVSVETTLGTSTFCAGYNGSGDARKAWMKVDGPYLPAKNDIMYSMEELFRVGDAKVETALLNLSLEGVTNEIILEAIGDKLSSAYLKESFEFDEVPAKKLISTIAKVARANRKLKSDWGDIESSATSAVQVFSDDFEAAQRAKDRADAALALKRQWRKHANARTAETERAATISGHEERLAELRQSLKEETQVDGDRRRRLVAITDALALVIDGSTGGVCVCGNDKVHWHDEDGDHAVPVIPNLREIHADFSHELHVMSEADKQNSARAAIVRSIGLAESAIQRLQGLPKVAEPEEADPPMQLSQYAAEAEAAESALNALHRAQGRYEQAQASKARIPEMKKRHAEQAELLAKMEEVRSKFVANRADAFAEQVSAFLPSSVGDSVYINAGSGTIGVVRGGEVLRELSNGQQAVVAACFALAAAETKEVPPIIRFPDRMMHYSLIDACAEAWADVYRGTIIFQTGGKSRSKSSAVKWINAAEVTGCDPKKPRKPVNEAFVPLTSAFVVDLRMKLQCQKGEDTITCRVTSADGATFKASNGAVSIVVSRDTLETDDGWKVTHYNERDETNDRTDLLSKALKNIAGWPPHLALLAEVPMYELRALVSRTMGPDEFQTVFCYGDGA